MEGNVFDNIIVGAGPAGMRASALARQRGESVALVERDQVGGTCLNRGCIPTKALVQSAAMMAAVAAAPRFGVAVEGTVGGDYAVAAARKDKVVDALRQGAEATTAATGATLVRGNARLLDRATVDVDGRRLHAAKRLVIATGSVPATLPLPGAELTITSDDFLRLTALPASLVVVGGGVIGMECACIAASFGCKVTVVECCREILPGLDAEMAKRLRTLLTRRGVAIAVGAQVNGFAPAADGAIAVGYADRRGDQTVVADAVMMATGRWPVVPDGAEAAGLAVGRKGIVVDEGMATNLAGVYAIGDCNGRLMLAHAATAQAEVAFGLRRSVEAVPSVVFTAPECAQVGVVASDAPGELLVGKAMYGANGMAAAMGLTDGFVKVAADAATRRIVGCCAIGAGADAIVQEAALAIAASWTVDDLRSRPVFAHPTLSELLLAALPSR